jgi:hypothetical protein
MHIDVDGEEKNIKIMASDQFFLKSSKSKIILHSTKVIKFLHSTYEIWKVLVSLAKKNLMGKSGA